MIYLFYFLGILPSLLIYGLFIFFLISIIRFIVKKMQTGTEIEDQIIKKNKFKIISFLLLSLSYPVLIKILLFSSHSGAGICYENMGCYFIIIPVCLLEFYFLGIFFKESFFFLRKHIGLLFFVSFVPALVFYALLMSMSS